MSKVDIRRAVKEHGLTIVQVAQKMGAMPQTIQKFITGNPTVEKLYLISDAIGCDVTDLFYPTEEEMKAKAEESDAMQQSDVFQSSFPSAAPAPSTDRNERQVHFCPHCGTKFQILE